jgi:sucrose-6-phosphate hydrolase SacC (GH32 family)
LTIEPQDLDFGNKIIEEAPLKLKAKENINLRVFIDNSIIEVFANDRQAICRRIYPEKKGNGIYIVFNWWRNKCEIFEIMGNNALKSILRINLRYESLFLRLIVLKN